MYTAKVKDKQPVAEGIRVTVEFTDGTKTITEWVIPQDEAGLKYWVKSRLDSLNTIEVIESSYNVGDVIDVSEPTPTPKTQAELDEEAWFKLYYLWIRVKTNLVDTGIVPINNPKVQQLLTDVKAGLKVEYIDKL